MFNIKWFLYPSFKNVFEMFYIKWFENTLSQTVFVPLFPECLLKFYLQTKMAVSNHGEF